MRRLFPSLLLQVSMPLCFACVSLAAPIGTSCLFIPGSTTQVLHTGSDPTSGHNSYLLYDDATTNTTNQVIVTDAYFIEDIAVNQDVTFLAIADAAGVRLVPLSNKGNYDKT